MANEYFKLLPRKRWDKELEVEGPEGFELHITVDYDDVPQSITLDGLNKMIQVLNEHWNPTWEPAEYGEDE